MRSIFLVFCLLAAPGAVIALSSQHEAADIPALVINEYLADPPDGIAGDANGDGARSSSQDEFVELVNIESVPLDIGGFTISDAAQVRFTFPPGTIIPAGEAAVVFGGGSPRGDFGNAAVNGLVFAVGGAGLSLNNGADSIIVRDSLGVEIARRDYPSSDGSANQSITRSPDATGDFVRHSTVSGGEGRLFSPGVMIDGSPFTMGPRITGIAPDRAPLGSEPFDLNVTGSGFDAGAIVFIDAAPVTTTVDSESELIAVVPASVTSVPGSHRVEVRNSGGNRSNIASLIIVPPPPLLSAVLPRIVQTGAGDFTIFLRGDRFDPGAVVFIEGQPSATTFLSPRELLAKAPAALALSAGTRQVRVRNGDGQQSNAQSFEVASPFARIQSLTPAHAVAGSPGFTLTINGANFRSGAVAFMDQAPLETARINETELRAEVPHSLIIAPALKAVFVQNDDGAVSNDAVFRIIPLAPLIHAVEPQTVIEGSGELTITITGERFEPGAHVRISGPKGSGPALATLFVTGGLLEAKLPSDLMKTAGRLFITVENPDFGVSNAAALDVLIIDPIVINEFLSDPPDGAAGDANGDGVRSASQDEFVEIVNRTSEPVDLSGYRVLDADAVRHIFAPGTLIPPFEAAVVFGGGSPRGRFGNAAENGLVVKASTGGLSLNNGGDRVRLEDGQGRLVQEIVFGAAEGNADQSVNREPDRGGRGFALHRRLSREGLLFSPGASVNGEPFTVKPVLAEVSPANARAGSAEMTITVSGSDFLPGAEVLFDQTSLATVFRSDRVLEASVSAELLAEGGAADVRVRNPEGQVSASARFLIVEDAPRIIAINPPQTGTGAETFELTVAGERFQRGAKVTVAGQAMETVRVTRGLLVARVPDSFFNRAAAFEVRVTNADEMRSNAVMLVVENGPLITRLSRKKIKAGTGELEITVGGLSFKPEILLLVDGVPVATEFMSETEMSARLTAEMTARAGTLVIQARNADGGRSNKATVRVVE